MQIKMQISIPVLPESEADRAGARMAMMMRDGVYVPPKSCMRGIQIACVAQRHGISMRLPVGRRT